MLRWHLGLTTLLSFLLSIVTLQLHLLQAIGPSILLTCSMSSGVDRNQTRPNDPLSGRHLFHKLRRKIGWTSRSSIVSESTLLSVPESTPRSTSQSTLKSTLSVSSRKISPRGSVSSITSDPLLQSTSGLPSLANQTSDSFEQSPPHAKEPRQKLLQEALQRLNLQEQATIERYISRDAKDISAFVDEAYEAAVDKQKLCEDKRWIWQIGSRTIELRHEAEKVISFLNRFKCVGDFVIKAAPSQAELPWAGFCLLLKVRKRDYLLVLL